MKNKNSVIKSIRYVILSSIAFSYMVLLCYCSNQIRIPGNEVTTMNNKKMLPEIGMIIDEMKLVHAPEKSFWIDPFEQSELAKHDYFSVSNQTPLVGYTVQEAENACQIQGKRLCTSHEWTSACLGTHRLRYSYSNIFNEKSCNTMNEAISNTGYYQKCSTDTGLYDMVGNAMEWTADSRSGMSIAMGGSFKTGKRADCFTKFYFPPEIKSIQIGFRCCHSH